MPPATWVPVEAKSHLDTDAHHYPSYEERSQHSWRATLVSVNATLTPASWRPLAPHLLGWPSICTTKALRMNPPIPQSWPATTQVTVAPTPSQCLLSGSAWQPNTLPPRQTDTHSTRAPPPSLAWDSAAAGKKGSRAADAKCLTSQKARPWSERNHLALPTIYPNPSLGYKDLFKGFDRLLQQLCKALHKKTHYFKNEIPTFSCGWGLVKLRNCRGLLPAQGTNTGTQSFMVLLLHYSHPPT